MRNALRYKLRSTAFVKLKGDQNSEADVLNGQMK
jgi:hypothetical protein